MNILVAQGIGDSLWTLPKLLAIARGSTVDLKVACWNRDDAESRAVDVLRRFPIIDSVDLYQTPRDGRQGACLATGPSADGGIYRYLPDGQPSDLPGIDYVAIANRAIDRGQRLESWLPHLATDWTALEGIRIDACDRLFAHALEWSLGACTPFSGIRGYVIFFHSALAGSSSASGWNRGGLWSPVQWIDLARRLHDELSLAVVSIGAAWDRDYWEMLYYRDDVRKMGYWRSLIGSLSMGQTLAVIQRARAVYSYPSGIGVISHYMRRPTCFFWRRHGNPIDVRGDVSPSDGMATAWTYPGTSDEYLPAWYGETTVDDIVAHTLRAGW